MTMIYQTFYVAWDDLGNVRVDLDDAGDAIDELDKGSAIRSAKITLALPLPDVLKVVVNVPPPEDGDFKVIPEPAEDEG